MSDIELNINTDVKRFEEWLDGYSLRTLPFIIDLNEDKALSVIGGPTYEKEFRGLRRLAIKASFSTISPEEPDAQVLSFPFNVIEFEIEEPAKNRLFIKARCRHIAMRPYFLEMMREISRLWPETETAIRKLLPEEGRAQSKDKNAKREREYRIRLNHTTGSIQPDEYEVDRDTALSMRMADNAAELVTNGMGNVKSGNTSTKQITRKVKSLYRDIPYSLEIIDSAIYSALEKLNYAVSRLEENKYSELFEELDEAFGFMKPCKKAIREVTTPAIITYHWLDNELGTVFGALGGMKLRKKQENLTEITLFAPPSFEAETKASNQARQAESLRRSVEVIRQLELEGYLAEWEKSADASVEDEQEDLIKLTRLQEGIIDAYQGLKKDKSAITIDLLIARLSSMGVLNRFGESYTREWVTKQRKLLEKMGYKIPL